MRDALSWAIQQAAGTLADNPKLCDEVLREKIMTYTILEPLQKRYGGFFETKIQATIDRERLQRKLTEYNIRAGDESLMISKVEKALRKIKVEPFLEFMAIGANGQLGNNSELHITRAGDQVGVAIALICKFDDKRFQSQVMSELRSVFETLPFAGRHEVVFKQTSQVAFAFRNSDPIVQYKVMDPGWFDCYRNSRFDGSPTCLLLYDAARFDPENGSFMCYHFPKQLSTQSFKRLSKLVQDKRGDIKISVSLYLLDVNGKEICRFTMPICDFTEVPAYDYANRRNREFILGGSVRCKMHNLVFHKVLNSSSVMISPSFFVQTEAERIISNRVFILPVGGEMWTGDFERVKSFKLVLESKGNPGKILAENMVSARKE